MVEQKVPREYILTVKQNNMIAKLETVPTDAQTISFLSVSVRLFKLLL